jgi:hypothetical protein
MRRNGVGTGCQYRRQNVLLERMRRTGNDEDPGPHSPQAALLQAMLDMMTVDASGDELPDFGEPVLDLRDLGDHLFDTHGE